MATHQTDEYEQALRSGDSDKVFFFLSLTLPCP